MPTLHLIIFKTPFFQSTAHWALLLPADIVGFNYFGDVFDVKKTALISKKTEFARYNFTREIQNNVGEYHSLNFDVEHYTLNQICQNVSKDRPFDLVTRNCQHWVIEVVEELVDHLNVERGDEIVNWLKALPHMPGR